MSVNLLCINSGSSSLKFALSQCDLQHCVIEPVSYSGAAARLRETGHRKGVCG